MSRRGFGAQSPLVGLRAGVASGKNMTDPGTRADDLLRDLFVMAARVVIADAPPVEPVDLILRTALGPPQLLAIDGGKARFETSPTALAFAVIDVSDSPRVVQLRGDAAETLVRRITAALSTT